MDKNIRSEEAIIREVLKEKGFFVEKIPESNCDSPDFLVTDNQNTYLIEFKIKLDEDGFEQRREETLERGDPINIVEGMGRDNVISKRIKKGSKQLDIREHQDADFRIIWYHAAGRFAKAHFDQLIATFYGSADIVVPGEEGSTLPCLYFTFSDFYKHKTSLDAAILTYTDQAQFCLNNYSPNYEKLKTTKLFNTFIGGIYDPLLEESKGNAYIADCGIDRHKGAEVLEYIEKKYGKKKMIRMEPKLIWIEIALDKSQEEANKVVTKTKPMTKRQKRGWRILF